MFVRKGPIRALSAPLPKTRTEETPNRPSSVENELISSVQSLADQVNKIKHRDEPFTLSTIPESTYDQKTRSLIQVKMKPNFNKGKRMMLKSYGVPLLPKPPSMTYSMNPCVCNIKAMIACKRCGVFCHDECLSSNMMCLTCLIR